MPAFAYHRQPGLPRRDALEWFAGAAGRALMASETAAVARVLAACPAMPWLWLGIPAATPPDAPRGVRLHLSTSGFSGDLRCALPLPMASECFGAIFLQHALDDSRAAPAVLDECARLLAPGGTLWLATLNPWSPYRARWAGSGVRARSPGRWQAALRRAGFTPGSIRMQWLGPHWQPRVAEAGVGLMDRFRGGLALSAGKQVQAVIPPTGLRQLSWQTGRWPLPIADQSGTARPIGPGSAIMRR